MTVTYSEVDNVFPGTGIRESEAVKATLKTVIEKVVTEHTNA
jgi:hypothetical protein